MAARPAAKKNPFLDMLALERTKVQMSVVVSWRKKKYSRYSNEWRRQ